MSKSGRKSVSGTAEGQENAAKLEQLKKIGAQIRHLKTELEELLEKRTAALVALPNLADETQPEQEHIMGYFQEMPRFDYPVKTGEEILARLGLLVRLSGAWGYRGASARVLDAMIGSLGEQLRKNGYEEMFLPCFGVRDPLLAVRAGNCCSYWELPAKSYCFSPAVPERNGKALAALQAVCYTEEQDQAQESAALLRCAQDFFNELGLAGRIRRPALAQMAEEMEQEHLLELWLPASARYLCVLRIGCAGSYLSRRHDIRVRGTDKLTRLVRTIHLTAHMDRLLFALAEQKQSDDGSIHLPVALWNAVGESRIHFY